MSESTILHVDMDAFFASVEERDNPALKGKAVVVGTGIRGVVSAANYEARKFGIHSAMPVGRAKRLAPHAIFVPPNMSRYSEVSSHIMEIFRSVTPLVEPLSLDEAFLDVTGAKRLLGDGREIAKQIRAKVEASEGITCSVGIATTKFIAKLASGRCKPNGMLEIASDRVLEFLHPLPVNAFWGVGPKTNEELLKLGLQTVADIANTPRQTLIRALGEAAGASLYELSWGRDYRDVEPEEEDKSISAAETFDTDTEDQEIVLRELLRLTERATYRMREKDFSARTISIKVRFADFKTITRSKTVPLAISATHEVFEVVKTLFLALKLDRARIRLVGVSLDGLEDGIDATEQLVLGERENGWRQATAAIDKASARFGQGSVRPARLFEESDDDA
jgi:DNA polymerase-4